MNIRWDYFVNQYETSRYIATSEGKDNRHIQFVREFASVVSVLQVRRIPFSSHLFNVNVANSGQNEQRHRSVQEYPVGGRGHYNLHFRNCWTRFRVL
jgi:hypothetical protein